MKKTIGTLEEIADALSGCLHGKDGEGLVENVSTDTRTITKGSLFFAIKGENTDGHLLLAAAVQMGAIAAVVEKGSFSEEKYADHAYIEVSDSLKAYQRLALYYREKFAIPIIAVTGSSGKTTTKDMTKAVLSEKFNVLASKGSFNNEIGLPLTIFELEDEHEVLIVEMGMRGLGQIKELCDIAKPNIGIITNVGVTHFELLGSEENIFLAKGELAESITEDGFCILNNEDKWTDRMEDRCAGKVCRYGISDGSDIKAENIRENEFTSEFLMTYGDKSVEVKLPLPGIHNILDALAASTAGIILGLSLEECARGLEKLSLSKNRLNFIIGYKNIQLIDDCYNANPDSTRASLNILASMPGRKVAVLGDMRELGALEEKEHLAIGEYAVKTGVAVLATVGPAAKNIAIAAIGAGMDQNNVASFQDNEEAAAWIKDKLEEADIVLVKGSRAIGMEKIVEILGRDS